MGLQHLKITYRNLFRRRSYSLINIFGLTLGLTCAILVLAYIGYERSYDTYHGKADRIYRVASRRVSAGTTNEFVAVPAPTGPTLVEEFPEVVGEVRLSPTVKRAFAYGTRKFFQDNVFYADRSIFEVFSFELVKGDPRTALEAPFTMVLTETAARKYFGDENPLGKSITWDNRFDYQVTGVVRDPPPQSHFLFEVLASFSTFIKYDPRIGDWRGGSFATYIEFAENVDVGDFAPKLENFAARHLEPLFRDTGMSVGLFLQPLTSIHLRSRLQGELGANGDIRTVYVFAAIALIILLVASINFTNLATAGAALRAKEVGVRKVLGAERRGLILQFLGETYLYGVLAFGFALAAARLLLPYFGGLMGRTVPAGLLATPLVLGSLAVVFVFLGLAAGSYPALVLSAFEPIAIIRGNLTRGPRGSRVRAALVAFQFAATSVLIVATVVIFNQMSYMQSKDLGFQKDNLAVLAIQNDDVRRGLEAFKAEVLRIPGVTRAGASSMVPGEMYLFNLPTFPEGLPRERPLRMDAFLVDDGFIGAFGVEVVRGRAFSRDIVTDRTDAVMINETAAKALPWDDPIGKTIEITVPFSDSSAKKKVIGVFRDIHQRSLYSVIAPTCVEYVGTEGPIENRARRLSLRLETRDVQGTMASIERAWKRMFPDHPFYAFFLDEFYAGQHRAEARLGGLFRFFTAAVILIACVGSFGLATFASEQRAKEIGIRKVLGSTAGALWAMLCRDFVVLVVIASALAWPVAYFGAKAWLRNFPYGVKIELSAFLFAALLILAVVLVTVGLKSWRAARANPVDALRYE
jgi:putative ABC transport system permease protein